MPQYIRILLVFGLMCSIAGLAIGGEDPSMGSPASYEPPRVLKAPFEWPGTADREALVYLTFNLSAEGVISNIELADGGFHDQRFVDAAIRFLSNAKLSPAKLNGVSTASNALTWPIRFTFGDNGSKGITIAFRSELDKVNELIRSGDYAGAHFHAQWMLAEKVQFGYEFAVLQRQLAYTYAMKNETHRALLAARAATSRTDPQLDDFRFGSRIRNSTASNYLLPKEVVVGLLELRMRLAVSQGLLLEGIKSYEELAGLDKSKTKGELADLATQVTSALQSNRVLQGKIQLDESANWKHRLWRHDFEIANVNGKVNSVYLKCGNQSRKMEYRPGASVRIPASWENCEAQILGEPETSFEIFEFPDSADSAPSP